MNITSITIERIKVRLLKVNHGRIIVLIDGELTPINSYGVFNYCTISKDETICCSEVTSAVLSS